MKYQSLVSYENVVHCGLAVYLDGTLCMDIIQDQWSPCQDISTVLMSIQSLLMDPNCSSPANPDAAYLYEKDRKAYNRCENSRLRLYLIS